MEWDSSASERKAEARTMPQSTSANFSFSFGSSVTISQSMRLVSIPVARRMCQRAEIISATRSCSSRVTGLYMVSYFSTIRSKSLGSSQARMMVWLAVQPCRSEFLEDFFFPSADLGPWDLAPLMRALSDCRSVVINNSCQECKLRESVNWLLFLVYC